MVHVLIEVAGGPDIGMGHVVRSIELARHLRCAHGAQVEFLCSDDPISRGKIAEAEFPFADRSLSKVDVWLVDRPMPEPNRVDAMARRRIATVIAALDYFEYEHASPDLIVNLYNHSPHLPDPARTHYAEGFEFAIVRHDLHPLRKEKIEPSRLLDAERLLVMLGGSDPQRHTLLALGAIEESGFLPGTVDVILGPQFGQVEAITDWASRAELAVVLHQDPGDLPVLMDRACLAISSGATTMLELLFLGIPTIVLPATRAEERFARRAETLGAVRCLDFQVRKAGIAKALTEIGGSARTRLRLSTAARSLVDGQGVRRIADLIFWILESQRRVPCLSGS